MRKAILTLLAMIIVCAAPALGDINQPPAFVPAPACNYENCDVFSNECIQLSCFPGGLMPPICMPYNIADAGTPCDGGYCFLGSCQPEDPCANGGCEEDPEVPEFGILAAVGVLALAGLFVHKKRN